MAEPLVLENGYWPDETDRNLGTDQGKQTKMCVLAIINKPINGFWPDQTDLNVSSGQNEQPEIAIGATEGFDPNLFPNHRVVSYLTSLSATQVGLANTCIGSRTSSLGLMLCKFIYDHV